MNNGTEVIPIADVDQRIAEIEEILQRLPIELSVLKRLRGGAVLVDTPRARTEMGEKSVMVANGGRLGPRDAVIAYLRRNPRVLASEVVTVLRGHIRTTSKDPKRLIKSTIYNLVQNGMLEQDRQGHLTVSANGRKDGEP